jgi:hypothetical protein
MNGIPCLCCRLAGLPRRAGALLASAAATPAMGGALAVAALSERS